MPYESRSYRSQSYVVRENKENADANCLGYRNNPRLLKDGYLKGDSLRLAEPNRPVDNLRNVEPLKPENKLIKKPTEATTVDTNRPALTNLHHQQLKAAYTSQIVADYSGEILSTFLLRQKELGDFLGRHSITTALRSKMVDWMIEVLSAYKMGEETFFRSVRMMDRYLLSVSNKQEINDLHLIGVTAMFVAAKYQQVHPFKLSVIYDKIARKKFAKSMILTRESDMLLALGFNVEEPTIFDVARHALTLLNLPLSPASAEHLQKILIYLCKMVCFSASFSGKPIAVLGASALFIALKTLEQVETDLKSEIYLPQLGAMLRLSEEGILELSREVLDLAKNFTREYPSLLNLRKFNRFDRTTAE